MGSRTVVPVLLVLCLFLPGCSAEAPSPLGETGWEPWEGRRLGEHGPIEVPAGPYEVRVGGPLAGMWLVPFEDDYRTSCPLLKPKPYAAHDRVALRIEYEGASSEGEPDEGQDPLEFLEIILCEPSGWRIFVGQLIRDGEEILVPPNTPLALLIRDWGEPPLFIPIAPVPADATEAVVREFALPTPTRLAFFLPEGTFREDLKVSFLNADYEELKSCHPEYDGWGNRVVSHWNRRSRHLVIEDARAETFATLALPESLAPGEVHHLGEVKFEPARKVRATILDDRGRPLDGLSVEFLGGMVGLHPSLEVEAEGEGSYSHDRIHQVRRLRIRSPGGLPLTQEVEGWGPFDVTLSSASVTVEVPEGDAARAWGYLDGHPMNLDIEARTLSVVGVPPGKHRLKVCLPDGHRRKRVIWVREAEVRWLSF